MKSLRNLFDGFLKSYYRLLFFCLVEVFNRRYVVRKLQKGINILGYGENYSSRFFRRGAATSVSLARLLNKEIQLLRR